MVPSEKKVQPLSNRFWFSPILELARMRILSFKYQGLCSLWYLGLGGHLNKSIPMQGQEPGIWGFRWANRAVLRPSISLLTLHKMISEMLPTSLLGNLPFFLFWPLLTYLRDGIELYFIFLQLLTQSSQSQPLKAVVCTMPCGQLYKELHLSSRFVLFPPFTEALSWFSKHSQIQAIFCPRKKFLWSVTSFYCSGFLLQ